ncbi:tyrosinase family oxidase copper chaperone [Actinoplanes sp. NPDC051475]|uniref:tyrosinase family oxidase copper chaperone n=1 Tax=Actinoplanes sp. NPDC051475 TaxID=3157225 RepID=UPI00344B7F26
MSNLGRRDVLRYAAAATAVVSGVVGAQALSRSSSAAEAPTAAPLRTDPRDFEIDYRGKKIKGMHVGGKERSRQPHQVSINGRKLAVMRIELPAAAGASGVAVGFISALNHYEPVLLDEDKNKDGLRKLAERAVDVLGDSELTASAGSEHDHGH